MLGVLLTQLNYALYENDKGERIILSDLNQIPNDVVWFSDMDKEELWLSQYIANNVKDRNFFNTDIYKILDLISNLNDETSERANRLLTVIQHIIMLCNTLTKEFSLDHDVSSLWYGMIDNSKFQLHENDFAYHLYQPFNYCLNETKLNQMIENGYVSYSFKKNGCMYASEYINKVQKLPNLKNSKKYTKKELLQAAKATGSEDITDVLNKIQAPYLVKINNRQVKPFFKNSTQTLHSFTKTYTLDKHIERIWMTSHEYKLTNGYVNYGIDEIIVLSEEPSNIELPTINELSYFSISVCIALENFIISKQEKRRNDFFVTIENAFVQSYYKEDLLKLSMLLEENGFVVYSFGKNIITVLAKHPSELSQIETILSARGYFLL